MKIKRVKDTLLVLSIMAALALAVRFFSSTPIVKAGGGDNWLQFSFDEEKSGTNPNELTLTTANVGGLKQVFTFKASALVDGAPVYLSNVSTPSGTRNLLFISEFNGKIDAVDGDTGALVWSKLLNGCSGCQTNSSPAIDPNLQFVYQYGTDGFIHKLQVGDGTEITTGGWPANVLGSNSTKSLAALAFATAANGNTYLYGSGGSFNIHPQGHVTAINLSNGTENTFNFVCSNISGIIGTGGRTCSSSGAGIWSRGGFAYHPGTDRLYAETAEWGTFAPPTKWSQSAVAIHADASQPNANGDPLDSYTPTNWSAEIGADHDLGSSNATALPDLAGNSNHYVMVNAKDSILRILDGMNMSGQGGPGHTGGGAFTVQINNAGEVFSSSAVYTDPATGTVWLLIPGTKGFTGFIYSLDANHNPIATQKWQLTGGWTSSVAVANGIAFWANGGGLSPTATSTLFATDVTTGKQLWSAPHGSHHWSSPIVVNGMVYMSDAQKPSTIYAYGLGTVGPPPPAAPTNLTASAVSSSQINLSWTASTTSGVTYTVMRNGSVIATGVTVTTFSDTGLQASTSYSYTVEAVDSAGTSGPSNQATATTQACTTNCPPPPSLAINAGGPAISPFVADEDFSGGSTINHANTINTSKVTNPAPAAVYQTARVGATQASGVGAPFTYTIPGFTAGSSHTVRLHFAETYFSNPGARTFNVSINGTQVLKAFDIYAAAGGKNIANIQQFTENANSSGQYVIMFTSVVNNALVSGIEIQ
jgi:chitodextrinase